NTATSAIPLVQATDLGALATNTPLKVTVALKLPNTAAVQQLLKAQNTPGAPEYRTKLTPAQFTAKFAPSVASVSAVTQYLTSRGFTNIQVAPNRMFVTAQATAALVQSAFNTKLER